MAEVVMAIAVTGSPPDPYESARQAGLRYVHSDRPGYSRRRAGKGWIYVDTQGKAIRDAADIRRIKALVIPPAWTNVWICPIGNGHLQAVGRDARGRRQYRYHSSYREVRDSTKFTRMLRFGSILPRLRERVESDLALRGLPREKVLAAVVRLLEATSARVGNEEYARTNESYGLTTLRDHHVRVEGVQIQFRFRGKSGLEHEICLRDRRLARIVAECQDLPGQELFQFLNEEGDASKILSEDVNEYIREIAGEDFTAKDIRTWNGTREALIALCSVGAAETQTEFKRNVAQAIKQVAGVLRNRPATCRKYYVHPAVIEAYQDSTICEFVERAEPQEGKFALSREEVAVLRLIEAYLPKAQPARKRKNMPQAA
jgi:DNA topoisomerase-1